MTLAESMTTQSTLLAVMTAEQLKAVFYLVMGIIVTILFVIYTYCEKRRKKLRGENSDYGEGYLDPDLCAYIKKNGEQCQHEPKRGSRYCALHSRRVLMDRIKNAPRKKIYEIDYKGTTLWAEQ